MPLGRLMALRTEAHPSQPRVKGTLSSPPKFPVTQQSWNVYSLCEEITQRNYSFANLFYVMKVGLEKITNKA